jgi:hypothetical protein
MLSSTYNKIINLVSNIKDRERLDYITTCLNKKYGYEFSSNIDDTIIAFIVKIDQMEEESLTPTVMKYMWNNGAVIKPCEETNEQYLHVTKSVRNNILYTIGNLLILCAFIIIIITILKLVGL